MARNKNDVARQQQHAASSESDKSMERASVKHKLTVDEPHKSTQKRARVLHVEGVNRVWSDEDVLVLLQAMIDYRSVNKKEPHADYKAFLDFVKDKLHVDYVSVKQLRDKITKLRKKYLTKPEKMNVDDDKVFELSKKVWGGGNCDEVVSGAPKNKDKRIEETDGFNDKDYAVENGNEVDDEDKNEGSGFKEMYPYLSEVLDSDVSLKQAKFMPVAGETLRGLENEWKDVFVKELKLYLNKLDLKMKLVKMVLDEMKSSDP